MVSGTQITKTQSSSMIQFLLAFFGGGGKYIGDPVEVLSSVVVIRAGIWGVDTLELSRSGRSDDVLPLLPPSRLKPRVRGVNGETGDPFLTWPVAAVGGKPGVRGTIPRCGMKPGIMCPGDCGPGVMGIMLGDLRISSSNSFSIFFSSLCSRISSRSSGVMKHEWTLIQNSTK